jgi:hypothetical protein
MSQAGAESYPLVPVSPHDTEFFLIAERGILEAQAVLLCKSIRRFAGAYAKSAISVVSPRRNARPCRTTVRQLAPLGVDYVELDLPSPCPAYGSSFKVLAAARMEDRGRAPVLVQLDSDTLFVGEPDFSLPAAHVGARPVDVKGMCTEGPGDAFDAYWHGLCELCDVDYESLPWVITTVDGKTVRANYNGGLIAARRACGIFQQTREFFLRLVAAGRKPWANSGLLIKSGTGPVGREGSEYWGTSQAALSLATTARHGIVEILSSLYNVPVHYFASLPPLDGVPVHIHYHWLLSEGEGHDNPMFGGRLPLPPEIAEWIRRESPLRVPDFTLFEKLVKSRFRGAIS